MQYLDLSEACFESVFAGKYAIGAHWHPAKITSNLTTHFSLGTARRDNLAPD